MKNKSVTISLNSTITTWDGMNKIKLQVNDVFFFNFIYSDTENLVINMCHDNVN